MQNLILLIFANFRHMYMWLKRFYLIWYPNFNRYHYIILIERTYYYYYLIKLINGEI